MRRRHIAHICTWLLLMNLGVVPTAGAPSRRPNHREMNRVRVVGTLPCADSSSLLITSQYEPHVLYGLCDGEHDYNKGIVFRVDTTTMPEKITHIDVAQQMQEDMAYVDDKFVEVGKQRFARIYEEGIVTGNAISTAGLALIDFGQKTLTHYNFSPLDSPAIGFTDSEGMMVKKIVPESPSDLVFMPETKMLFVSTINHLTETDTGDEVIQPSTLLLYSLKTGKPQLVGFGGAKQLLSRLALVGPAGHRSLGLFHKPFASNNAMIGSVWPYWMWPYTLLYKQSSVETPAYADVVLEQELLAPLLSVPVQLGSAGAVVFVSAHVEMELGDLSSWAEEKLLGAHAVIYDPFDNAVSKPFDFGATEEFEAPSTLHILAPKTATAGADGQVFVARRDVPLVRMLRVKPQTVPTEAGALGWGSKTLYINNPSCQEPQHLTAFVDAIAAANLSGVTYEVPCTLEISAMTYDAGRLYLTRGSTLLMRPLYCNGNNVCD